MNTSDETTGKPKKAKISDISTDLALRDWANDFFDRIESLPGEEIEVDFSGVLSISRSFAHQYLLRRDGSKKKIEETNVPLNVRKMFEIVRKPAEKGRFPPLRKIEPIPQEQPHKT